MIPNFLISLFNITLNINSIVVRMDLSQYQQTGQCCLLKRL